MQKIICILFASVLGQTLHSMKTEQSANEPTTQKLLKICAAMPSQKEKETVVRRAIEESTSEQERDKYINEFNNLCLSERVEYITRGAIFNRTSSGLIHPAFSRLSPEELDKYFRKINFPDKFK